MNNYTVIFFEEGVYNKYKKKLKDIFTYYDLNWLWNKQKFMSSDEINDIYSLFGFNIDDKYVGRNGGSGVWQNRLDIVKMISIEKINDSEHLPVILIVKGDEVTQFHKDVINYCVNVAGCEVKKLREDESGKIEEVISKKVNVKLVDMLNDEDGRKNVMKENFLIKIKCLKDFGYNFSDSFINNWISCIDKFNVNNEVIGESRNYNKVEDVNVSGNKKMVSENKNYIKIVPRKK